MRGPWSEHRIRATALADAAMALVACRHRHGSLRVCRQPTAARRTTRTYAAAGGDEELDRLAPLRSQEHVNVLLAWLGGVATACRRALGGRQAVAQVAPIIDEEVVKHETVVNTHWC